MAEDVRYEMRTHIWVDRKTIEVRDEVWARIQVGNGSFVLTCSIKGYLRYIYSGATVIGIDGEYWGV